MAAAATGGVDAEVPLVASASQNATVEELRDMFRAHMRMQQERDKRADQETARQENRWKALQHQFTLLQEEVHTRTTLTPVQPSGLQYVPSSQGGEQVDARDSSSDVSQAVEQPRAMTEPRLQPLNEDDDVEHFLTTFERIATACRWPRIDWAVRLVPLLTGKARSAYVNMDINESLIYDSVKAAVLKKYDINPETYRLRFRSTDVGADETPKELYVRLKDTFNKWVQPQNRSKEEVAEVIIMEQYLRVLAPELQTWVKEHNPDSAARAAELADVFVAARRRGQPWSYNQWKAFKDPKRPSKPSVSPPKTSIIGGKSVGDNGGLVSGSLRTNPKVIVCYQCGQEGHTKPRCPNRPSTHANLCGVPRPDDSTCRAEVSLHQVTVCLNGQEVSALVDTGCMQTLVKAELVPVHLWSHTSPVAIKCVHGDERFYPTANVYVQVQGQTYLMEVGLSPELPYPVVLGQDLPVLFDLLPLQACNAAVTRAMAKSEEVEVGLLGALPFFDSDLEAEPGKTRKSRSQRRCEKYRHAVVSERESVPENPLGYKVPSDIVELQKDDSIVGPLYRMVEKRTLTGQTEVKGGQGVFCLRKGILFRKRSPDPQLVVPREGRELVLSLGHSVPWAGHLGRYKTTARILRFFYWPGMRRDIALYCKTCPQCQQTSLRVPPRAPLEPLPVIGVPFDRLGMDIVGPLVKTKAGNRYMLVITDYATKYPEVFPLKSIKARAIAGSLIQLFSRVGFPKDIVTDQGSNFMSDLLRQVYKLLGIKGIRTTPYHPQTDGLTERFNQTLKQMLRKFVTDKSDDWDQWLPYLLFAYREVPQTSTGFSPFELLYGREVRGPLMLLKDMWGGEQDCVSPTNIVDYVVQMREKLEAMSTLAQEHMAEAQKRQKTWYDQKARTRNFEPGTQVLVMLPTDASKLTAKWQGPFKVLRKLGPVTYEVATPGQKRTKWTLHVNLLKEWSDRPRDAAGVFLIRKVEDEEEVEAQYLPVLAPSSMALSHLSKSQQLEIQSLCDPQVFQKRPGHTYLVEHDIVLREGACPKRMSYRIPERLLEALRKELDEMLAMNIVEPSKSEWCSPVVLVPKKDGSLRFCIDFRYLNSVSKFDSYPTPRIEDLIDRLGKANYLTTIDLAKGYWQVPLSARSRELTAFRTPWGLYHFCKMPFGLHGAAATFQRLMDQVLADLTDFTAAYLDDIVIYSSTWEEHLQHLQVVIDHIRSAGLTINPSKCSIAKAETEYLGYVIGQGVIKPQVKRVQAIQKCPLPQTKSQIRSFLGMANWYRRFVPNFSVRAAVLTDLTRKNCPNQIRWTGETEKAFQDIKNALCQGPVLCCPDFDRPFILQTDASDVGVGAVLLQGTQEDRHPVAYISRKLFPREVRYSTVEKECLAVKWALDTFKYYLLGREFVLETDHRALQWMNQMKDSNARITRWYLSVQPYRFSIQHVPGRDNATADFLSRLPA